MVTTAADRVFVDTDVLVYSAIASAPLSQTATANLTAYQVAGAELWLSRQNLREYLAVLSRPQTYTAPVSMALLLADVAKFQQDFLIAEDGPAVTAELAFLLGSVPCGGKQVHDANIVATMLAHGIPKLLTNNSADFNRFAAHISVIALAP